MNNKKQHFIGLVPSHLVLLIAVHMVAIPALANKICHSKPPGQCEECCRNSNETKFKTAVQSSCSRLKGANRAFHDEALKAEVTGYYFSRANNGEVEDTTIYKRYLEQNCDFKTGVLSDSTFELSFSKCAEGCPKPSKTQGKGRAK